jgi:hypothetical protein
MVTVRIAHVLRASSQCTCTVVAQTCRSSWCHALEFSFAAEGWVVHGFFCVGLYDDEGGGSQRSNEDRLSQSS